MSSTNTNKQVLLKKRPDGPLTTDLFELSEAALPSPGTNQFLVRAEWLSLDPFMVGRMRAEANYAQGVQLGEVMQASAVGRVIESNNDNFPVGNLYVGMFGLQEYAVSDGSNVSLEVDPERAPASMALGILGMPGMTAYFGLLKAGEPQEGETVLVSACGGPVGGLVGQIAKIKGCRAVGITSVDEKRRYAIDEFGFDEVVLYKDDQGNPLPKAALIERIGAACPEGVDVYFDNVGGDIYDATLPNFNIRGRIIVCGRVAAATLSDSSQDVGPRDNSTILVKRLRKQGFLVSDHAPNKVEALDQLTAWLEEGKVRHREDVVDGIERAPEAFIRMMRGDNRGKQLVRLDPARNE